MLILVEHLDINAIPSLVWKWVVVYQEMRSKGGILKNTNGKEAKRRKDSSRKKCS